MPVGEELGDLRDRRLRVALLVEQRERGLDQPALGSRSIPEEQAPPYLGFLAAFAGLDNPTSNDRTRELLGWEPSHPGWVEDVQAGHYFA